MISNKDMVFVWQAMAAAKDSTMKYKHGASLSMSGKYMGAAKNSITESKNMDWSMHAEINVIRQCQIKGMQ